MLRHTHRPSGLSKNLPQQKMVRFVGEPAVMWTVLVVVAVMGGGVDGAVVATTSNNDIAGGFQTSMQQQNIHSILLSIEERLRNLDRIYSMHLSPSIEEKLEQYQRRLESIDTKIMRMESLVMLNLDKISENISTKNFKDDIAKTSMMKKVDALYEGISQRLGYVERKFETSANKIQNKLETTLTRLEKMDEALTRRNEFVEIELSEAMSTIDDLKAGYLTMEESIVNNTNENFEVNLKEQVTLMKSFNDKSNRLLEVLYENVTREFAKFEQKIEQGSNAVLETNKSLEVFKTELKRELNEYAVKVAEMNSENWKTGSVLQKKQNILENVVNSTKTELQTGIRTLMVLIGKITKEPLPQADQTKIEKLNEKIDANFEKVFSAQNLFLDSCYRLQMDESQIELKISNILEKLMETFEKKTAIEIKDIKNLEKLIKSHDSHITRNLHQAGTNIATVHEKITRDHKKFESQVKQVTDHLNALFSVIQDNLLDENASLSKKTVNRLLRDLTEIEAKIAALDEQGDVLTRSVAEMRAVLDELRGRNSTATIEAYFGNVTEAIRGMEAKMNAAYLYYYLNGSGIESVNHNLTRQLRELIEAIRSKTEAASGAGKALAEMFGPSAKVKAVTEERMPDEKVRKLVAEIFGRPANETEVAGEVRRKCSSGFLKLVDVRGNFGCDEEVEATTTGHPGQGGSGEEYDDLDVRSLEHNVSV